VGKSISSLFSSSKDEPPITIIYGVDGVGKTSLAAEFPDPIYLNTEGETPPNDIEMPTPGVIESYKELIDFTKELAVENHDFKTAIFDSLDGIEPLVWAQTVGRIGADSINSNEKGSPAGYGRGYTEADKEWSAWFKLLKVIQSRGVAVILLAHPKSKVFESPISDPYARYQLKLQERGSDMLREKSDIVAFVNYRTTLKEKEMGFKKTATHGEGGGDRTIHLEERPGFLAKNRYGMPATIPFKKGEGYKKLSQFFPAPTGIKIASNDNDEGSEEQKEAA
jgi:hypothetical protein